MFKFSYKNSNNKAPLFMEGDYNLHIEGCEMTMTDKGGNKTTVRCHVDDEWRLSKGLEELVNKRMNEHREVKIGDIVKFVRFDKIIYPHAVKAWCEKVGLSGEQLMTIYTTIDKVSVFSYDLLWSNKYVVQYLADKLAYVYNKERGLGMIVHASSIKKVDD